MYLKLEKKLSLKYFEASYKHSNLPTKHTCLIFNKKTHVEKTTPSRPSKSLVQAFTYMQ